MTRRDEYRVKWERRPDLDREDFIDTTAEGVHERQEHTRDGERWRIDRIVPGADGQRDLIVFKQVE
jgi:hypothetical protein